MRIKTEETERKRNDKIDEESKWQRCEMLTHKRSYGDIKFAIVFIKFNHRFNDDYRRTFDFKGRQ